MYPIIDYRNCRYQGQIKNNLPDGIGIILDANQMFCMAEWVAGEIKGPTAIVYPSGRTFCGHIQYHKPESVNTHQLESDHVQLVTYLKKGEDKEPETIAGILPLQQNILEIDNTNPKQAKVVNQYPYSIYSEEENLATISRILNLDSEGPKALKRHANCLRFMEEYFAIPHGNIIQFMINERNGKKQYFFGLRGGGLGIKLEPLEQPTLNLKKTGRVYYIRALGVFSPESQLKQLGMKMVDNAMKGIVVQQGVFSLPNTLIKYQINKRPKNCWETFYNYLKRSLFYRDKVMPLYYLYSLEKFVKPFNTNLREIETQKIAQVTIEKPNNSGENLIEIQRKRTEKDRKREDYLRKRQDNSSSPNPYNPDGQTKYTNPEYNLQRAKDQIYRSVSKKRQGRNQFEKVDYKNVEYVDPNYTKVTASQRQPRSVHAYAERQNKKGTEYTYDSDKNYTEELKQFYERKFTPKKDTKDTEWKSKSRSPYHRDSPERTYQKRSPYPNRNSPERGYSNGLPGRKPPSQRYTDRYKYNDSKQEYGNGTHFYNPREEEEEKPYTRQGRYREKPYRREEAGYDREKDMKYQYYFDNGKEFDEKRGNDQNEYDYRPYRQRKNSSSYQPYRGSSPGKKNLRKKILKDNHYD